MENWFEKLFINEAKAAKEYHNRGGGGADSLENPTVQFISEGDVVYSRTWDRNITVPPNPVKESTAQYTYSFLGWSLDGANIVDVPTMIGLNDLTYIAVFKQELRCYTVRFLNGDTVLQTETLAYGVTPTYKGDAPVSEEDATAEFLGWTPTISSVTGDVDYLAEYQSAIKVLNDYTWDEISAISAEGAGANYFSVGECKAVDLKGTVGTLELDTTLYAYILGFDHNSELEGNGITFGTFKTASESGIDVALCDVNYNYRKEDGTKYLSMYHWGYVNYGGWAGSDMRYDILGSTDVQPSGYGAEAVAGRVGYNPSDTCTSNPVANTLMAALPADLRAVLKPITKYTDNVGSFNAIETNVTSTIDYLPLLAEFEVFGSRTKANEYEKNKQAQYTYFAAGNSKKKYRHYSTDKVASWLERSPDCNSALNYCLVSVAGTAVNINYASESQGLAPIFLV